LLGDFLVTLYVDEWKAKLFQLVGRL